MKKEVKKDSAKNVNANVNAEKKPIAFKQSAPAVVEKKENLPAKKSEVFNLQAWYDKNLGAIDCEKCAWSLAQSITMIKPLDDICGHVHSNGTQMYACSGSVIVILTTPVMPAGVYDPVLAGKGNAKRRTFIPVNVKNGFERLDVIVKEADDPEKNRIVAEETFDFSINAPLYDTIFAMQFFNAAHGFILSDVAISTITAACQKLKFKLGENYSILENDILRIIFKTSIPRKDQKSRVIDIIGKYKINIPALVEPKAEPAPEKAEKQKAEPKSKKQKGKARK